MKNRYEIIGESVKVYSNGKNKHLHFFVDLSDLSIIANHSWRVYELHTTYKRVETSVNHKGKAIHYALSRFLLSAPKGVLVDHIDCDPLNNRRINLRIATEKENSRNVPKTSSKKSSIYKGVSWHKLKGKWIATCATNSRNKFLGYFDDEIEAAKTYDLSAKELHGEFAKTNFH